MDEEEPNKEHAESQSDSENKEIINEEETSVSSEDNPINEENSEKKEEASINNEVNQDNNEEDSTKEEENPKVEEKPLNKKGKEGSWTPMIIVMGLSLAIAFFWDKVSFIQDSVHYVLDPSAGALLNWNITLGMLVIVFIISSLTTVIQKYATDQEALRELKKEQKILQEEMKKYKDHPEKVAELSKKQLQFIPKTFKLTSRAIMFTGVPFILFFRWFNDAFTAMGDPKFFGFLSWFWFYLISMMIFSSILRKTFKVV